MESKKNIKIKFLNRIQKVLLLLIFSAAILIGIMAAGDYGVAWDDHHQIKIAKQSCEYIIGHNKDLFSNGGRFFGSAFEIPIYLIQSIGNTFSSQVLIRHLVLHFYFIISLYFFFKLLLKTFQSYNIALLGIILLYINPIIFAHSFFNTKDLAFLSTFIISLYTMWNFIDKPHKINYIIYHAIVSAFLIDIRLLGLLIPAMSIGFLIIYSIINYKEKPIIKPIFIYIVILLSFIYIFWPFLWPNPKVFFNAFIKMASYPSGNINLFNGITSFSQDNPWYYIPLWIGVSTPLIVLILYASGIIFSIKHLFHFENIIQRKEDFFIIILSFIPIDLWLLFLILEPTFYDGWRHLYFIAPLLIIGSLLGIKNIFNIIKNKKFQILFKLTIAISIIAIIFKLVELHPYQQVYMNCLVSKKPESIRKNWEMDYWGLSFKEGFEKILSLDSREHIKVKISNISAIDNWKLSYEKDPRIELTDSINNADYFISNYRFHPKEYPYKRIFSIKRQGSRILSIYTTNQ